MAAHPCSVEPGMVVLGSDQRFVGLATRVRATDFLVRRSMLRQAYVPFSAVRAVEQDRVVLDVPADEVDEMGWPHPLDERAGE